MREYLQTKSSEGRRFPLIRELLSSKRFRKLFLGYAAVFMLPLVLLYLWVVRSAIADKKVTLETTALESLATIAEMVDRKLDYANWMSFNVGDNAKLRPAQLKDGVASEMEGVSELDRYIRADDFWDEIYYKYEGTDRVYTSVGTMDWEVVLNRKLQISERQVEELNACMDDLAEMKVLVIDSINDEKSLLFMWPLRRPGVAYRGVLMCQVNSERFDDILKLFVEQICSIYVTDADGNVLYTRHADEMNVRSEIAALLPLENGVSKFRLDEEAFSCVSYASDKCDWRYTAVISDRYFFREVVGMHAALLTLVAVCCLLGTCLMSLFSWMNYRPILFMRNIAFRERPELEDGQLDDLEAVHRMIEWTLEQKTELESSILEQKRQIGQQTLRHLLSGFKTEDMPILIRAMNTADIQLNMGRMCVFILARPDSVMPCDADEAVRLKTGFDRTHFRIYTYLKQDLGALVIVASYKEGEQFLLAQLLYQETMLFADDLILSVSDECTEFTQLSGALEQACSAMNWAREISVDGVIFFNELDSVYDGLDKIKKEYIQSIRQNEEENAQMCAEKLIGWITVNHSYEFARVVLCELLMELFGYCGELRIETDMDDRIADLRLCSFEELRMILFRITHEIIQNMLTRKKIQEAGRGENLLEYVDAHYCDPELSLKLLSDQFGMSPNYISRVFRESAGIGFSEYVSDKRMQYIKTQLSTSEEPIKDIILSAGYRDVSNFMRKFKQVVGCTPGEYRKNTLGR